MNLSQATLSRGTLNSVRHPAMGPPLKTRCEIFNSKTDYNDGVWWSMSTDDKTKGHLLVLCFDMRKLGCLKNLEI